MGAALRDRSREGLGFGVEGRLNVRPEVFLEKLDEVFDPNTLRHHRYFHDGFQVLHPTNIFARLFCKAGVKMADARNLRNEEFGPHGKLVTGAVCPVKIDLVVSVNLGAVIHPKYKGVILPGDHKVQSAPDSRRN